MFENRYTNDNKYRKVRDHCHYAGEYRGDWQRIWNLRYSIPKEFSVIVHIILKNTEKYKNFHIF